MRSGRRVVRLLGATLATALVAALATACSSSGSGGSPQAQTSAGAPSANGAASGQGGQTPAKTTSISVGLLPLAEVAPFYLGMKKGFFKAEGLKVTPKMGVGGSRGMAAVAGGSVDFSFASLGTMMVAQEKGLDPKVVAAAARSTTQDKLGAIMVKKDSPIKKAGDLAGKTLAINQLETIDYAFDIMSLESAGATKEQISKIKWIEIGFPEQVNALAKGRVDAITAVEPFATQALLSGKDRILVPTHNINHTKTNLLYAIYFTSGKFAKAHPDVVSRFQKAMNHSLSYAQAHKDEARAMIPTYTKLPPDVVKNVALAGWDPTIDKASVDYIAKIHVDLGILKKQPDLDKLIIAKGW